MKKITLLGTVLIAIALSTSCRKKDTTPEPEPEPTPAVTTPTTFWGILYSGDYTNIINGSSLSGYSASAYFSNMAVPAYYPASGVSVSSVYLNNDSLNYNTSTKYYQSFIIPGIPTETWTINGANGIPSFTYVNALTVPSCNAITSVPDSIRKSIGFTLNVSNVANTVSARVIITDGTGSVSGSVTLPLANGNNTVTLSPANLTALATSTSAAIGVVLENKASTAAGGKDFLVIRQYQYTKRLKIVQ